ncbi:MAG: anhydro-N-acetylmuramic acid kinase [Rubrivivax sp.]|nr:anhydro-N-acetylmuramic acid kinase [Rubrivivax sp.]
MWTIGLMSGTSADGVDGVLVEWPPDGRPRQLHHEYRPFDDALRHSLLALNRSGPDELHRSALAANALARVYADVVTALLASSGLPGREVAAIGAHGQTVRHQPGLHDGTGYTLQLLNAALLAELCGIDVVHDLRSRDVAAGGQGAPLVPALHQALFAAPDEVVAVLNIGGIANLSLLPPPSASPPGAVRGFDCGPGNALMDSWCESHTGQPYDAEGRWAAQGRPIPALLTRLLSEPFLTLPPPKSTGRDLFDRHWLEPRLEGFAHTAPADVQATLAEFTVQAAAQALMAQAPDTSRLVVCGGGARNRLLMDRLAAHLPRVKVIDSGQLGLPVDQVEALAFAWLARAHLLQQPGNLPAVTGARGSRRLGSLTPAR